MQRFWNIHTVLYYQFIYQWQINEVFSLDRINRHIFPIRSNDLILPLQLLRAILSWNRADATARQLVRLSQVLIVRLSRFSNQIKSINSIFLNIFEKLYTVFCSLFNNIRHLNTCTWTGGVEVVNCSGLFHHSYPFDNDTHLASARVMWKFMKTHTLNKVS